MCKEKIIPNLSYGLNTAHCTFISGLVAQYDRNIFSRLYIHTTGALNCLWNENNNKTLLNTPQHIETFSPLSMLEYSLLPLLINL